MERLTDKHCVPCHGGVPALGAEEVASYLARVEGWETTDGRKISRRFPFDDFVSALDFACAVGAIAEEQGHHPDLHVAWGSLGVEIWTHAVGGLTESDFILAARIDRAWRGRTPGGATSS